MTTLVNLLPWRARRRRRRAGLWAGLFCGSGAAVGAAALLWFWMLSQTHATLNARISAAHRLQLLQAERIAQRAAFTQRIDALTQKAARRQARQKAVADWQPRLLELAARAPQNLWFTSLAFTERALRLQGRAQHPDALAAFQQRLRQLPGFAAAEMGETSRDDKQGWRFSLSLHQESKHGAAP